MTESTEHHTPDFDPRDHGLDPRTTLARVPGAEECRRTSPGHEIHFIQARLLGQHPERWQDAVITEAAADGRLRGRLLDGDEQWWGVHHASLADELSAGAPVQVNIGTSAIFVAPGQVRSVRFSTDGPPEPLATCRGLRPVIHRAPDGTETVTGYTADGAGE